MVQFSSQRLPGVVAERLRPRGRGRGVDVPRRTHLDRPPVQDVVAGEDALSGLEPALHRRVEPPGCRSRPTRCATARSAGRTAESAHALVGAAAGEASVVERCRRCRGRRASAGPRRSRELEPLPAAGLAHVGELAVGDAPPAVRKSKSRRRSSTGSWSCVGWRHRRPPFLRCPSLRVEDIRPVGHSPATRAPPHLATTSINELRHAVVRAVGVPKPP